MANIADKVAQIRQALFGKDVRENIASGIESINSEVEDTTTKQNNLGSQFNSLVINAGSSNAEIVAGRTSAVTGQTFDTMGHRIDDHDTQLAENATQITSNTSQISNNLLQVQNVLSNSAKSLISKALMGNIANLNITILGDSISQGVGATNIDNSYVGIIFNAIKKITNNGEGTGYELTANFNTPPEGVTYSGTYAIGTNGAVKQSIILQPGATITFTRSVKYIELYYHATPTSGKIEFRQDGTLYRTVDCSGTEDLNKNTIGSMFAISDESSHTYTLTCTTSSVEITGVMCWTNHITQESPIYLNRFAVNGTSTGDYVDSNTLDSILKMGSFDNDNPTVFIIALGTNDIYNSSKAVSSATYKENLNTIASYLLSNGHKVVLQVPLVSTSSNYSEILEPFENYRKAVYELAIQLNIPLLDLSKLILNGNLTTDGIHPSDAGHYELAQKWINFLGIPKYSLSQDVWTTQIILNNSWVNFGNGYYNISYMKDALGFVHLRGTVKSGVIGNAIFTLPMGYRPSGQCVFPIITNMTTGLCAIASNGDVNPIVGNNAWFSVDGITFKAEQ